MNMLVLMDRITYVNLLMLYSVVSIDGRREGVFPRCEVTVQRGTTVKKMPQQSVTVSCPVAHCGKSPNVTWCKLSNTDRCQRIIGNTENVEIRQEDSSLKHEVISYLTLRDISVYDDGLYRCDLRLENGNSRISHHINISVSDTHQGVESDGSIAAASLSRAVGDSASWQPYFYICGGVAALVLTLTALTLLQFYGCKKPTSKPTRNQAQYVLNDLYSQRTARTPPPLENSANEHQQYAVINHARSGISTCKQHVVTEQDKESQYAAIIVS